MEKRGEKAMHETPKAHKKAKRVAAAGLGLALFLFVCAVINIVNGHIGATIASVGAGIFFLALSFVTYEKSKKA